MVIDALNIIDFPIFDVVLYPQYPYACLNAKIPSKISETLSMLGKSFMDYMIEDENFKIVQNYIKEVNENFCNNQKSFCHGDFTLDNMLWNDGLYLIDPIYSKDNYSSWLLDVSKLLQSCRRFNNVKIKNHFENKYSDILPI